MREYPPFEILLKRDQTKLLALYRASQSGESREREALEHAEEIMRSEYQ